MDPGSGEQLEVLADPPIEEQSPSRVGQIDELDRVADHVIALVIERLGGHVGLAPVTGKDVGALDAHFHLVGRGHQLERGARNRHPDHPGAYRAEVTVRRERCRLGGAPARHHQDPVAGCLDRQILERNPQVMRQRGARVEDEFQPAEEVVAQLLVGAQHRNEHVVGTRHVEVHRRRNFLEVPDRLLETRRCRLAFVDVDRAAPAQHHVEVVVTAEGVAPG